MSYIVSVGAVGTLEEQIAALDAAMKVEVLFRHGLHPSQRKVEFPQFSRHFLGYT